jgi:hypothetical protein
MPWKDTLKMNEKIDFAMKSLITSNFRQLCQEHGISPKTGYKWKEANSGRRRLDHPQLGEEKGEDIGLYGDEFEEGGALQLPAC